MQAFGGVLLTMSQKALKRVSIRWWRDLVSAQCFFMWHFFSCRKTMPSLYLCALVKSTKGMTQVSRHRLILMGSKVTEEISNLETYYRSLWNSFIFNELIFHAITLKVFLGPVRGGWAMAQGSAWKKSCLIHDQDLLWRLKMSFPGAPSVTKLLLSIVLGGTFLYWSVLAVQKYIEECMRGYPKSKCLDSLYFTLKFHFLN